MEDKEFLENLLEARTNKAATQTDVAKAVGVSLFAYQNWERCVITPNPDNMAKLKEYFKEDEGL